MTGKNLNYKPSTIEQAKFDYSLLSKFFNKGLKEEKKKEHLKRLKNIEDKSEEQLEELNKKFSGNNKDKHESDFNHESRFAFFRLYRDLKEI